MRTSKTLYLANPYGFSKQQREGPLADLVSELERIGAEVWEPFALSSQVDDLTLDSGFRIGQSNVRDVREAERLFAVLNGCPPDEGVMVELGLATAWNKPTFLFRDDFRIRTDLADPPYYPLNLMLFTGLPRAGWRRYWYTSIEELTDSTKALVQWLDETPTRST